MLEQPGPHHTGRVFRQDAPLLSLGRIRIGKVRSDVVVVGVAVRVQFI